MFFSKAVLVVVSCAAISVLATPHALNHALHHRAIAARVQTSPSPNNATLAPPRTRRDTQRCRKRPIPSSSSLQHVTPSSSSSSSSPSSSSSSSPALRVQPTPTTTQHQAAPVQPSPTPTQQPSSGSSGDLPSYLIGTQTGAQGTFYATGLGACGITNTDSDFIAAVSYLMFDSFPDYNGVNPNTNPICNRKVKATYQGKSVTVTITDRCTGCKLLDLDFSPAAYDVLALPEVGRISGMSWVWL
jgi:hypothetical protein